MSVASASLYRGLATLTGLQNWVVIRCQSIPSLQLVCSHLSLQPWPFVSQCDFSFACCVILCLVVATVVQPSFIFVFSLAKDRLCQSVSDLWAGEGGVKIP